MFDNPGVLREGGGGVFWGVPGGFGFYRHPGQCIHWCQAVSSLTREFDRVEYTNLKNGGVFDRRVYKHEP